MFDKNPILEPLFREIIKRDPHDILDYMSYDYNKRDATINVKEGAIIGIMRRYHLKIDYEAYCYLYDKLCNHYLNDAHHRTYHNKQKPTLDERTYNALFKVKLEDCKQTTDEE